MIAKVDFYMNSLYTDCEETVKRCSSVGMIVFGALFNTVAMIFIIINFVNVKNNEKILKEIKYNQDVYNNRIWYMAWNYPNSAVRWLSDCCFFVKFVPIAEKFPCFSLVKYQNHQIYGAKIVQIVSKK